MTRQDKRKGLWALHGFGQKPWLDFISRDILTSGELKRMIEEDGITGVTTNPSIFEKAVNSSSDYDVDIGKMAREGKSAGEIYEALAFRDVREAADLLKGVYDESKGTDGFVSIEVSPHFAADVEATIESGVGIFNYLGKKNILIKVPATAEGNKAIEELLVKGVNINATLIFSIEQYEGVARAYLRALKRRKDKGLSLSAVHSVASVFVSRIDTAVDKALDRMAAEPGVIPGKAGIIRELRGRAAVANSCRVYHRYREIFSGREFRELETSGAALQNIVWGSTSTKDPSYSDVKYVEELIGRDTVNTIPLSTVKAFKDHGTAGNTLDANLRGAGQIIEQLLSLGIDVDVVCRQIQYEGVRAFTDSYDNLFSSIEGKRQGFVKG
ncbi:MAG: transaldolase [Dehalococcoidia bacterium]|nr:transaldolase [Dehalococcoidia bacterium]